MLKSRYLFRYYGPKEMPSKVKALEERYAGYLGVKHCLAVNSCTSALIASLIAVGVEPGDEVIVPAYTFFASCAAVVAARAIPIVAEVDRSLTMDPLDLERKITKRTKAILPVHMRGMPAKMDKIMEMARRHNLKVVEDVAQANGGSFQGRKLGSFGDAGAFSLQYHKTITSGEGGVVATSQDLVYTRAQAYHDVAACWRKDRFAPPEFAGEIFFGVNFRMSELTGAVALAQFGKMDTIVGRMKHNKQRIKSLLAGLRGHRVPGGHGRGRRHGRVPGVLPAPRRARWRSSSRPCARRAWRPAASTTRACPTGTCTITGRCCTRR